MFYVSTMKSLPLLAEIKGLAANDTIVLFYREQETCKVLDFKAFMEAKAERQYVEILDRDDMLIQIGGLFVRFDDTFVFLDKAIPVPKRYADRVLPFDGKAPVKKKSSSSKKKKPEPAKPEPAGDPEEPASSSDAEGTVSAGVSGMNPPEGDSGQDGDGKPAGTAALEEEPEKK